MQLQSEITSYLVTSNDIVLLHGSLQIKMYHLNKYISNNKRVEFLFVGINQYTTGLSGSARMFVMSRDASASSSISPMMALQI